MSELDQALALTKENNAWSAQQAQKQMDFQERMSNTAHQREIEDLKAAGLNPVLSAKLGGASTPNGAMAQADTSGTSAVIDSLLSGMNAVGSASGYARQASQDGLSLNDIIDCALDFAFGSKAAKVRAAKKVIKGSAKFVGDHKEEIIKGAYDVSNPTIPSGVELIQKGLPIPTSNPQYVDPGLNSAQTGIQKEAWYQRWYRSLGNFFANNPMGTSGYQPYVPPFLPSLPMIFPILGRTPVRSYKRK